jgi:hypothetical protein
MPVRAPAILARTEPGDDSLRFVVDIGGLKGYRIVPGDFVSRESAIQTALF